MLRVFVCARPDSRIVCGMLIPSSLASCVVVAGSQVRTVLDHPPSEGLRQWSGKLLQRRREHTHDDSRLRVVSSESAAVPSRAESYRRRIGGNAHLSA